MPDILITHSYHLPYDSKQLRKMQPYPPLGMLYAASALREAGISVAAFDTMLEEPSRGFRAALAAHRPRIVVVYEDDFNFLSKMCLSRMRDVAWEIARAAKELGAATVVHGSDSTDNARLFLQNGFDYVLCGESEQTLVQLCGSLLGGATLPELDGMVRCGRDGALIQSAKHLATNPEWTEIRLPARDLIDMAPYRAAWREAHGYFSTSMVSSRGCPYRCNWCAKPISGNRFHLRPAENVANEMKQLKKAGVEHIWFGDDVFALNQEWVGQFSEAVTRQDAAVPFKIQSRANLMTEATVRDLKAAGCAEVWMGVESGSQAVLNAMDKGLTVESIIAARERLGKAGIRACYFLQLGYPGERWRELQQTIALVRATRPDDIGVSFSYPLPGTVFYEKVQEQLGRKRNWVDSDDLCIMFTGAYKTEFYRAVRDALHAEVDSWRSTANETSSSVDDLWRTVQALEPASRNPDAFDLPEQSPRVPAGVVLPLGQLLSSAKA
ncbi:MAG TPA: radical SAM protein [Terracidiphilus sp.]|nr:radical SAM protein [Terracidiphilus sp.]